MSSALSNLSISLPFSSESKTASKQLRCPPIFHPITRRYSSIKSMAEGIDNLDHLQRVSKQQQPKKRVAPVTPVGIWDRFPTAKTVQQMMDTMERIIEDPFGYPSLTEETGGSYRRGRTPWEIKEGANEYRMRFDMPGMTKEDVRVWVEEKMLVVKAEKVAQKNGQEDEAVDEGEWSAKSYGRYSSRIALPENVEMEKIKAEVKDGVLYLTIPKASNSSKVVDINVQ